jgi:hypothetical protein
LEENVATVHLILQGKGGVGKSMIAAILYQVLARNNMPVHGYDTDPANKSFSSYKEFSVKQIDIMKGDNVNSRAFDALMAEIFQLNSEDHVIVDSGASSFIPFNSYLKETDGLNLLREHEHTVYFHTIVTGGQAIIDTLEGIKYLALSFPEEKIVVWLNPFFGEIIVDGLVFEEFNVYKDHERQFAAIVRLPETNASLLGRDLMELFAKRQSFESGITSSSTSIMVRSRLKRHWDALTTDIRRAEFMR